MSAADMSGGPFGVPGADDDPDRLDARTLALVGEAASLLREAVLPRQDALEQTIQRVKVEAVAGALLGAIGGSLGRVARAAPQLMGITDPVEGAPDGP